MSAPDVRLSHKKSEIEGADDLRLQGQTRRRSGDGRASAETPSGRFDVLLDVLRPCLRRACVPMGPGVHDALVRRGVDAEAVNTALRVL